MCPIFASSTIIPSLQLGNRLQKVYICPTLHKAESLRVTIAKQKAEIERLKIDIKNEKNWGKIQTKQTVKDTAKEIFSFIVNQYDGEYFLHNVEQFIAEKYGVEVE